MTLVPACEPRSAAHLDSVIDGLELTTDPTLQRRALEPGGPIRTFCNRAVERFCEAMGVHIPKGLLARQQIHWLEGPDGQFAGWFSCSSADADKFASQGCPVIVGWVNPVETESSHIAMHRSAPGRIAQAGHTNFVNGTVANGFGFRTVRYFAIL